MSSLDPKAGNRYLTVTGAPVQVLEVHEGIMVLQSLASDNRLCVPTGYPLQPFDQGKAAWEMRLSPYTARSKKVKGRAAQNKPLAPLIDAMLLAGGKTMRGMIRELNRGASAACKGKNVGANIRARQHWLMKAGRKIFKDRHGRIQVK